MVRVPVNKVDQAVLPTKYKTKSPELWQMVRVLTSQCSLQNERQKVKSCDKWYESRPACGDPNHKQAKSPELWQMVLVSNNKVDQTVQCSLPNARRKVRSCHKWIRVPTRQYSLPNTRRKVRSCDKWIRVPTRQCLLPKTSQNSKAVTNGTSPDQPLHPLLLMY